MIRNAETERDEAKIMNRFDLTRRLVAKLEREEAVIGGIGNTNFDLWAAGRRPQNFYMLGSMGLACPIALGVAIAQPQRRVFALEGDGSRHGKMDQTSYKGIAPEHVAARTLRALDHGRDEIVVAKWERLPVMLRRVSPALLRKAMGRAKL